MTATTAGPFSLSVYPASVRLVNLTSYKGHIVVTDSGTAPLHVTMSGERLTHCATPAGRPSWLHISETSFTLQPGHARTVGYTVSAAPGTTGSAAVVATGTPVTRQHGNATLSGSIGSRVTLGATTCHSTTAAPPARAGGNPAGLVIVLVLLMVITVAVTAVIRKLRRRGTAS